MAVTQYIGSRYVPLFADPIEWSAENTYEPLTIVLHEGNSFTSKQAVPKGIALDNEEFWAETGNFNAQIEQYRRETAAALDAANDAMDAVEALSMSLEDIKVHTVDAYSTPFLVETEDGFFLLDCGETTDSAKLTALLTAKLGSDAKLKMLVITHYDPDHYGGFAAALEFCDVSTAILEQMPPTVQNGQYERYTTVHDMVRNACAAKGFTGPDVPDESQRFAFGNTNVTLNNATLSNRATYDAAYGYLDTHDFSTLNNYSLIVTIEYNKHTFRYAGDIETAAQRLNVPFATPVDVCANPHHLSGNYDGFFAWYAACNPQVWVANKSSIDANPAVFRGAYMWQLYRNHYIEKAYILGDKQGTFTIGDTIRMNAATNYASNAGDFYASNASYGIEPIGHCVSPMKYINDNSYAYRFLTLAELRLYANSQVGDYQDTLTSGSIIYSAQFVRDLETLLGLSLANNIVHVHSESGMLVVTFQSANSNFGKLYIYPNFNLENRAGFRYELFGKARKFVLPTPVGNGDNISASGLTANDIAVIQSCNTMNIRLNSGGALNLNFNPGTSSWFSVNKEFSGYYFTSDLSGLLSVKIGVNGAITMKTRNLTSGTVIDATEKIVSIECM